MGMNKICIDAGHGGYDAGNIVGVLQEKALSLGVAQELNTLLTNDGNFETIMTRSGDYAAGHYEHQVARELSERARISNESEADLFLSIHFTKDGQPSDFVNDTKGTGIPDLIVGALKSTVGTFGEFDETDQYVVVAREAQAPSVILSLPILQQYATPDGQQKLANDLYDAICQGFGVQPKAQATVTRQAEQAETPVANETVSTESQSAPVEATQPMYQQVTVSNPAQSVSASASGVTLVTHSELSTLLSDFTKSSDVSAGLSAVKQYIQDVESKLGGYVKVSDIEQIVLSVIMKALTKTNQ